MDACFPIFSLLTSRSLIALLAIGLLCQASKWAPAQRQSSTVPATITVLDEVTLAPSADGFLSGTIVQPGQLIRHGDIVFELDSDELKLEIEQLKFDIEVLEIAANDASEMESIRAQLSSAEFNLKQLENVQRSGVGRIPELEMVRSRSSVNELQATLAGAQKKQQQAEAELAGKRTELKRLQLTLQKYRVASPFAGQVVERFHAGREFVERGKPVAKIYRMDRLVLTVMLLADTLPPQNAVGTELQLKWPAQHPIKSFRQKLPSTVRIERVAPKIESDQRYLAFAEIENLELSSADGWVLIPGLMVEVQVVNKAVENSSVSTTPKPGT